MSQQLSRRTKTTSIPTTRRGFHIGVNAAAWALIAIAGVAWAQPAPRGAAAGGLADLLDAQGSLEPEPDGQPAASADQGRPAVGVMPGEHPPQPGQAAPPHGAVAERLRRAIDERHAAVTESRIFETLATIEAEEGILAGMERTLKQCDVALTAAKRVFARLQTMALGGSPGADVAALEMPAAQMALIQAANHFEGQRLTVQAKRQELQPLYEHALQAITSWMEHYREMRRCVGQDRRDPNGSAVVDILETEISTNPDFFEGRILVAVAHMYHGDPTKAAAHLRAAQGDDALGRHLDVLASTDVAFDRAVAWVLLGEPKEIAKEMQAWDARWLNHKSPRHLWLLGLWYATKGQDQESERRFDRCLRAAGFNETKEPPPISAAYLGDAAFFYLTTPNPKYLRVERARKILARVPEGEARWQVLRARAADLAEQGEWKEAVELLHACERCCPLTLMEEVRSQVGAYEREQAWTRPPPAKKKPAA